MKHEFGEGWSEKKVLQHASLNLKRVRDYIKQKVMKFPPDQRTLAQKPVDVHKKVWINIIIHIYYLNMIN